MLQFPGVERWILRGDVCRHPQSAGLGVWEKDERAKDCNLFVISGSPVSMWSGWCYCPGLMFAT